MGESSCRAIDLALADCKKTRFCAGEPRGGLDDRIEHRLQIEGRAADDLKHVARRGLVFERFLKFARAGLQFTEQPRIFHCNDGLRGEVLQQQDLFLSEWTDLLPVDADHPEQPIVLPQRDCDIAAAAEVCLRPDWRHPAASHFFGEISDADDVLTLNNSVARRAWCWGYGLPRGLDVLG
jgi:hypothetical protein